jgi:O-antigen ligase
MIDNPISAQNRVRYHWFFSFLFFSVFGLTALYVFASPFPYTTAITNISFHLAVIIAVVFYACRIYPLVFLTPVTIPFMLFFLWASLSLIWALNFENTLNDIRAHLLNHLILFFIIVNFFNSKKRLQFLIWTVLLSALVFSVIGMVYYYIIMGSSIMDIRFGGLLADRRHVWVELPVNAVGVLSIPAMLFCYYFYEKESSSLLKVFLTLSAIVIFSATVLTQSRGTLVAVCVSGLILLFFKNKKLVPVFLIIIIIVMAFSPFKNRLDTHNFSARIKINYASIQVVKDYPLLGIGYGINTFAENLDLQDYVGRVPEHLRPAVILGPHSWLLDLMVRLGLIGLVIFLSILIAFARMSWSIIKHARDKMSRDLAIYLTIAFVSYFVIGLAEPLFIFSAPSIIFYVLVAMMTILWMINSHDSSAP